MEEERIDICQDEASFAESGVYLHELKKPVTYNGVEFHTLKFDFGSLTGNDVNSIHAEMAALKIEPIMKEADDEFLIRAAVRACAEKIGDDIFDYMTAKDCMAILTRAKGFLTAKIVYGDHEGADRIELDAPVNCGGAELTELRFEFDRLTGRDVRAISGIMKSHGSAPYMKELDSEFQSMAAVRACTDKIGVDDLRKVSARDYLTIMQMARHFFIQQG